MGKMMYALLMVFSVEFALWLFAGQSIGRTDLFGLIINFRDLSTNLFFLAIIAGLGFFALAKVTPGQYAQVNLFSFYASVAAVAIYFSFSIVHFGSFVLNQLNSMLDDTIALAIVTIVIAPMLIFYLVATMEWVRSNQ